VSALPAWRIVVSPVIFTPLASLLSLVRPKPTMRAEEPTEGRLVATGIGVTPVKRSRRKITAMSSPSFKSESV